VKYVLARIGDLVVFSFAFAFAAKVLSRDLREEAEAIAVRYGQEFKHEDDAVDENHHPSLFFVCKGRVYLDTFLIRHCCSNPPGTVTVRQWPWISISLHHNVSNQVPVHLYRRCLLPRPNIYALVIALPWGWKKEGTRNLRSQKLHV